MEVFAKQLLSSDLKKAESKKVVEASTVIVKDMIVKASERTIFHSSTLPPAVVLNLASTVHIIHFLGNLYKNETRFENFQSKPLLKSSDNCHTGLESMELYTLLVLDRQTQAVTGMKRTIDRPDDELGFFDSRKIGNGVVIWYYHGSYVYENMTKKRQEMKTHGRKDAGNRQIVSELGSGGIGKDRIVHELLIDSPPSCARRCIHYAMYLPADCTLRTKALDNLKKDIIPFWQRKSPLSLEHLSTF